MNITVVKVPVGLLNPAEYNPRKIEDKAIAGLQSSIERFGLVEPIVWNKRTGNVVGGHQRLKVLLAAGRKELFVVEVDLDENQEKTLNLTLNNPQVEGDWTEDVIDLIEQVKVNDSDLSNMLCFDELQEMVERNFLRGDAEKNVLDEEPVHNGMSFLDGRTPMWIERKSAWDNMGIDNGLVQNVQNEEIRGNKIGLSTFDPVLCEYLYRWYCPEGGVVLDPFSGCSVRGIVASVLKRKYVGVDLRKEQVDANVVRSDQLECSPKPMWIVGDSCEIDKLVEGEFDFVFSCPPYFDLERYSALSDDLSNMEWDDFIVCYRDCIKKSVDFLKEGCFACFVVSDVRDDGGFYRGLVGKTIDVFMQSGLKLYNEFVYLTSGGVFPVKVRRRFSGLRKFTKTHQSVLVFKKG